MPISNIAIYEQIVRESYAEMVSIAESGKTLKEDGSGFVIKYDSSHSSFKKSMVVVTFSGMWLEAKFHLFMVKKHSKNQFSKYEKDSYKEKLKRMGISDSDVLDNAEKFQKTRNELIHEKAFMDKGEIKQAQSEAEIAYKIADHVSGCIAI